MTRTLAAIYEGGLLRPLESLDLAEHTRGVAYGRDRRRGRGSGPGGPGSGPSKL
ncbi:MAG: antitoxin family protein [Candidatus Tectomicrobia bacterium]|uniref:Antitoxin family protein n=1 Tax=Tectimicrobiota bacterium TaxID=2528274 RepID=A0A932CQ68_UNCTE|nr:antitoxin family protein [Candidatus Tectomicrobia bacterium]